MHICMEAPLFISILNAFRVYGARPMFYFEIYVSCILMFIKLHFAILFYKMQ